MTPPGAGTEAEHQAPSPTPDGAQDRLLKRAGATLLGDLGNSLTTKAGSLFVLCDPDGDIDRETNNGHGLYFHDTRHLDLCRMRLDAQSLSVLLSEADGPRSVSELTNPDIQLLSGTEVRKDRIAVRRERLLGDGMSETVEVFNFSSDRIDVTVGYDFDATFENMFVVRGSEPGRRGKLHEPRWDGDRLAFRYDGADGRRRSTVLSFQPSPTHKADTSAAFHLSLEPGRGGQVVVTAQVEDAGPGDLEPKPVALTGEPPFRRVVVESTNALFDRLLGRCFADLRMLVTRERGDTFFAAGVPWYVALFGRDSLITALQTLAYDPSIAANTLRLLAKHQGATTDDWRDEEPGKILHELRVGEMANLGEVPQTPYYGTVDATPLFVILAAEYVRWTADLDLATELRPHVDRALEWIDRYGDSDGDGFVDYERKSRKGSRNQGWKDSWNSIVKRDGALAEPPIALVEVQGYVYRAKLDAAWLCRAQGDEAAAARLEREAAELRARFAEAFWIPEQEYLALALQKGGGAVESTTSNAGQALWSGIVDQRQADAVRRTLMSDHMFSGWGIRTLAQGEAGYNPIDYQVGSVWPHDNSLVAAGLKLCGFATEASRVFSGIFEAAARFPHYRLPEVFAGFSREKYSVPVRYPVACNPQAWAAGTLPYLLHTALGLRPNALQRRLEIDRPFLPEWLRQVTVRGLRVGSASVDLHFERSGDETLVGLVGRSGDLELAVTY